MAFQKQKKLFEFPYTGSQLLLHINKNLLNKRHVMPMSPIFVTPFRDSVVWASVNQRVNDALMAYLRFTIKEADSILRST